MKHDRLYKLYLTDSIRKEAFVGSWVVLECAEAMARHYLNLYAHSMKIEVVDTATMDTIGEYEIGSGKLVMNNTLNKAIDGYHANIARITEDFKRGSYKNEKECEIDLVKNTYTLCRSCLNLPDMTRFPGVSTNT